MKVRTLCLVVTLNMTVCSVFGYYPSLSPITSPLKNKGQQSTLVGWESTTLNMGNIMNVATPAQGKQLNNIPPQFNTGTQYLNMAWKYAYNINYYGPYSVIWPQQTADLIDSAVSMNITQSSKNIVNRPCTVVYTTEGSGGTVLFTGLVDYKMMAKRFCHLAAIAYFMEKGYGTSINYGTEGNYKGGSILLNPDCISWLVQNQLSGSYTIETDGGTYTCATAQRGTEGKIPNGKGGYVIYPILKALQFTDWFLNEYKVKNLFKVMDTSGKPDYTFKTDKSILEAYDYIFTSTDIKSWDVASFNEFLCADNWDLALAEFEKVTTPPNIPFNISSDFKGFVIANNYLVNKYGPNVPFGWDIGVYPLQTDSTIQPSAAWLQKEDALTIISDTVAWYKTNIPLNYNQSDSNPQIMGCDFVTFDLSSVSPLHTSVDLSSGWLLNAPALSNWFSFIKEITTYYDMPGILWQVSAGVLPVSETGNWTYGNTLAPFIFGQANVGELLVNLADYFSTTPLPSVYKSTKTDATLKDYLLEPMPGNSLSSGTKTNSVSAHDWTKPNINIVRDAGIIGMYWGGTNSLMPGFSVQIPENTSMNSPNTLQYLVDHTSYIINGKDYHLVPFSN